MRRLGRHLFTLCSAVSLLLFVAVCATWARSVGTHDWARYAHDDVGLSASFGREAFRRSAGYEIHSVRGRQTLLRFSEAYELQSALRPPDVRWTPGTWSWSYGSDERSYWPPRTGIAHGGREWIAHEERLLSIPDAPVALSLLVLPIAWVVRQRRASRPTTSGLCSSCGYDLRASPDRCPECGTPAKQRP